MLPAIYSREIKSVYFVTFKITVLPAIYSREIKSVYFVTFKITLLPDIYSRQIIKSDYMLTLQMLFFRSFYCQLLY